MKVENAVASSSQSGLDVGIENSTDGKNRKKKTFSGYLEEGKVGAKRIKR